MGHQALRLKLVLTLGWEAQFEQDEGGSLSPAQGQSAQGHSAGQRMNWDHASLHKTPGEAEVSLLGSHPGEAEEDEGAGVRGQERTGCKLGGSCACKAQSSFLQRSTGGPGLRGRGGFPPPLPVTRHRASYLQCSPQRLGSYLLDLERSAWGWTASAHIGPLLLGSLHVALMRLS